MTQALIRHGGLYAIEASARDVLNVAMRLREEDMRDVESILPMRPRDAVYFTAYRALWCIAIRRETDGLALGIIGVGQGAQPGAGIPWLLSAQELFDHPRAIARYTRWFMNRMLQSFDVLMNWTDMRNIRTLHWLRWAGATIFKPEPFGAYGLPFHRFEIRRKV
jgi:hypothetical protein